jgi:hypothetical protein
MGGAKEIKLEGIGEASVGHLSIPRRALAEFIRLQVGRKNESESAINDERPAMHIQWYANPDRIGVKSPGDCAREVHTLFGERGFIIPLTLIGKGYDEAIALFDFVMPKADTLAGVIKGLTSETYGENSDRENLRLELLAGAYTAQEYIVRYTTEMAGEVLNAPKTGKGKGGFDTLDIEYFREIGKPLPEELPAMANAAMGKEIAASLNASKSTTNDELLKAVLEQNQLLAKQFAEINSRQAPATEVKTEPAPKKAVGQNKDK